MRPCAWAGSTASGRSLGCTHSHTKRFTPRRKGSIWSAVNIRRVEILTAEGRMQPAGLAGVCRSAAAENRVRHLLLTSSSRRRSAMNPTPGRLQAHPLARGSFSTAQPAGYRQKAHLVDRQRQARGDAPAPPGAAPRELGCGPEATPVFLKLRFCGHLCAAENTCPVDKTSAGFQRHFRRSSRQNKAPGGRRSDLPGAVYRLVAWTRLRHQHFVDDVDHAVGLLDVRRSSRSLRRPWHL